MTVTIPQERGRSMRRAAPLANRRAGKGRKVNAPVVQIGYY
jgi:hypothetical protein